MLMSFVLSLIACIGLSLAMKRHFLQIYPQSFSQTLPRHVTTFFHLCGWFCLLGAAIFAVKHHGYGIGLVYWLALLPLATFLQTLLLTYRPSWIVPIGIFAIVVSAHHLFT